MGVLVAFLLYRMMLVGFEAHLVAVSLLLFPGVEAGGSDPQNSGGLLTGLTKELFSCR